MDDDVPDHVGFGCRTWPEDRESFYRPEELPQKPALTDGATLVLGLRFRARVAGALTAVRFYKPANERGVDHVGKIFDWGSGRQLAQTDAGMDDSSCPCPGWVSLPLTAPLQIRPGVEYVVAIDCLRYYSKSNTMFDERPSRDDGLVTGPGSGVYTFTLGAMPNANFERDAHYFVDGTWGLGCTCDPFAPGPISPRCCASAC